MKSKELNFIITGNEDNKITSTEFRLDQNYPNPFNPATKIHFSIPRRSNSSLIVYDVLGREIKVLLNRELNPGDYEVDFDGSQLTSGIYFYKLTSGSFTRIRKMILIK